MTRHLLFWALLGLWAATMALSIVVPMNTAPTDFGFTRGMNRITLFLQFQAAGLVLGVMLLVMARDQAAGWRRWLARLPMFVVLLQVLAMGGLILWAQFGPTNIAPPPDLPVTEPAD